MNINGVPATGAAREILLLRSALAELTAGLAHQVNPAFLFAGVVETLGLHEDYVEDVSQAAAELASRQHVVPPHAAVADRDVMICWSDLLHGWVATCDGQETIRGTWQAAVEAMHTHLINYG